jgi:hypothetical protein
MPQARYARSSCSTYFTFSEPAHQHRFHAGVELKLGLDLTRPVAAPSDTRIEKTRSRLGLLLGNGLGIGLTPALEITHRVAGHEKPVSERPAGDEDQHRHDARPACEERLLGFDFRNGIFLLICGHGKQGGRRPLRIGQIIAAVAERAPRWHAPCR